MKQILVSACVFCFCLLSLAGVAQSIRVTGIVSDSKTGAALSGVSVLVKGTTQGTVTDSDGAFVFNRVPENTQVVFSFIGYESQTVTVRNHSVIHVSLVEQNAQLSDVVVIGYGQVKKKDLSTAVSSIKDVDLLKSRSISGAEMLEGRIAGVNVVKQGGDPTADPIVTIRGKGSRNGESPLWVVDGVPNAPYNAEDIESISVLKDAASAAIYGSNVGSAGVILITTKRAKQGDISVSANFNEGFQSAWKLPSACNAQEMAQVKTLAALNSGQPAPAAFDATKNPWGMVSRTNWIDQVFRTGKTQHLAVSITGGSDKMRTLASFEYDNNQGTLLNTYLKSFSGKVLADFKISKNVTFSQWVQFSQKQGYSANTNSGYTGIVASAIYMPPAATVYDSKGNFGGVAPADSPYAGSYGDILNPVAQLLRQDIYNPVRKIHSSSTLDWNILRGLSAKSVYTIQGQDSYYADFSPKITEPGKPNDSNSRTLQSGFDYNWLWENTLNYQWAFGDHNVSAVAGYSSSYNNTRGFGLTAYGFQNEASWARNLVNATDWTKSQPWEDRTEIASDSWFGRFSYSYADRYFLTSSLRHDKTSKLYIKNNGGTFPAFSGAWKISSEPFFHSDIISLLKFRGSWGQVGNVGALSAYTSNITLTSERSAVLGKDATVTTGLAMNTVANTALKWETAEQTDLGFDMELLKGKINITGDYYNKTTKNLIEQLPISGTEGISNAPYGNIGSVSNKGLELAVDYNDHFGDFHYSVGVNVSRNKNEVADLGPLQYIAHDDTYRGVLTPLRSTVGQPWYSYYLVKTAGIFKTDAEAAAYVDKNGTRIEPNAKAGDLKFVDQNGDGIINDQDRVYMGSYAPKYTYGLTGTFSYKNFDLSFQLQGIQGVKIFNAFKNSTLDASVQGYNMSREILNAWSATNTNSNIPIVRADDPNKNFGTCSDWYLEDGSYARMKNLTIGYTLPQSLFAKLNAPKAHLRVYCSAENLFTITKYSGMDPEVGGNGIDGGTYPVPRIFTFGLNLGF